MWASRLVLILCFLSSPAWATKYYVKTTGSDGAGGTSDATAWATISKVNATTFSAGDSLLFNRGDTWNKVVMILRGSGSVGHPIYIGAYGAGARPILDQRDTISGWSSTRNWTDQGGNLWTIGHSGYPYRLWIDDVAYAETNASASMSSRYRWYYVSHILWVYSVGNPATTYSSVKHPWTGSNDYVVDLRSCLYITLQSLDLRGGKREVARFGKGLVVDSCNIGNGAGIYGLYVSNQSIGADSGTVRYCTFDFVDTLNHAFEAGGENQEGIRLQTAKGWDIHHNVFRAWAHACINGHAPAGSGFYIIGNKIHDNEFDGGVVDYCRAFGVQGGNKTSRDSVIDNHFYRNYIHNMTEGSQMLGRRTRVYYNWFDSLRTVPYYRFYQARAICFDSYASTVTGDTMYSDSSLIANNTICLSGGPLTYSSQPGGCVADTFANNIIWYPMRTADATDLVGNGLWIPNHAWYVAGHATPKVIVLNNLFFGDSTHCIKYRKWMNGGPNYTVDDDVATFNTETDSGDVIRGNVWGDPLFISSTNRRLSAGSPAFNAGVNLGFTTDFDGNPISGRPDIGAFEYQK